MKNILVLYYSQTGQIRNILDQILSNLENIEDINIDFVNIQADPEYPFPWSSNDFFSVFPDSKVGNNCTLKPIVFDKQKQYDLVILGLQVWYLEPSIPIASFLRSKYAEILKNKPVITLYGVRNMWINAHHTVKNLIHNTGGHLVGNIVLADKHNNLISVLTIVRWLLKGKKEAGKLLPTAGVSDRQIQESSKFGTSIKECLLNNDFSKLQVKLMSMNAVEVDYHIMKTEFAGSKLFGIWADLILKKSTIDSIKRKRLLILFKYYLYFVIFIVSPISSILFRLIRLIFKKKTTDEILKHVSLVSKTIE